MPAKRKRLLQIFHQITGVAQKIRDHLFNRTQHLGGDITAMADTSQNKKEAYFNLQMELEGKKYEYRLARRPLIWFRNIVISDSLIILIAVIIQGIAGGDAYITGWCQTILWLAVIFIGILAVHFFNVLYYLSLIVDEDRDKFGFRGIERIQQLISLKAEIERLETALKVWRTYQTSLLSIEEQLALYKDELLQATQKYQRQAKHNRNMYFAMQMIIIACSLFVGSLTSGLTGLISILNNHWIAPALSFIVSFLTAMVTLFKPREKGYNLQQTADAVEYEISCSGRRIFGYEGLNDRQTYTKLAQEVEKLRNEQRKRQQQLEQSSEMKQTAG